MLQLPSLDRSCRTPLCLDSSLQRAGIGPAVVQQQLLDAEPGQGHSSRLQTAVSGNCSPDILSSPVRSILGWGVWQGLPGDPDEELANNILQGKDDSVQQCHLPQPVKPLGLRFRLLNSGLRHLHQSGASLSVLASVWTPRGATLDLDNAPGIFFCVVSLDRFTTRDIID